MEKRAIIAIVLSLSVLMLYQYFYVTPKMNEAAKAAKLAAAKDNITKPAAAAPQKTDQAVPVAAETAAPPAAASKAAVPAAIPTASAEAKTIKIDTQLYTAVLSSSGGVIKSFKLKDYKDKNGTEVYLIDKNAKVPALSSGNSPEFNFMKAAFNTSSPGTVTITGQETGQVVFTFDYNDIHIKRTYTFYGNSYKIALKDETAGIDDYYITPGSDFSSEGADSYGAHNGPVILKDMERIELKTDKALDGIKLYDGNIKWIAQENKYFFDAIAPVTAVKGAQMWNHNGDKSIIGAIKTAPGTSEFVFYVGPKKYDDLKSINASFEHIVDFGFFSIIARPIFWLLMFINKFIGNYGWSIILLTLIIRIPFIPLISKGQSSMKKLQKVQPLMNEIREKYKKDPQRMQQELMALYKKHKVNPMGGCLPMLVQIPVFFALYKVLLVSIELRGAPFMLWITDLSAKDPHYVLPIIMGGTMFLQQKMTPTTMDPAQAKVMMFMPIIFTFMFLSFPSGLVLYWLVSNVLSIVQQAYINKKTT
ncbi:MAG: membrane protein insertase YidC [Candidatus Magnetominusculus sp. LBB02]|nr:membrane protein insertase YidC [Candidatus Magnetominusculus sp. LBB02]